MFDSSGAEEPTHYGNPATIDMDALSHAGISLPETQAPEGKAKVDVAPTVPGLPKQISASGRTLLQKYFSESSPVDMPSGHFTVAFSESQVHSLLLVLLKSPRSHPTTL